jgi:NADP-dependent 3-hydroxy acid dehydrogenase YdfG
VESNLTGTVALVTGASSGIGAATARQLANHGAAVALVAPRQDRLDALAAEIDQAGGTALVAEADITHRTQAEAAVQQTVDRFGGLDTPVNNAGLMLLGPWEAPTPTRLCCATLTPPGRSFYGWHASAAPSARWLNAAHGRGRSAAAPGR